MTKQKQSESKKKSSRLTLTFKNNINLHDCYGISWPNFAAAAPPKEGNIVAATNLYSCREEFGRVLRCAIDRDPAHYEENSQNNWKSLEELGLDLRKVRVITVGADNTSDYKDKAEAFASKGLVIVNAVESAFGIRKTTLRRPKLEKGILTGKNNVILHYFLGHKIWHLTPYHLSLYLLLIRLGRYTQFKDVKTLDELSEKVKEQLYKNPNTATSDFYFLRSSLPYIEILLKDYEELTDGAAIEEMWSRSRFNLTNYHQNVGFHQGIKKLYNGTMKDTAMKKALEIICKRKGIPYPTPDR